MTIGWIEKLTGSLADKRRYRDYKARMRSLPEPYRIAVEGMERYLMYFGGIEKGDVLVEMLDDLGELFEQSAAQGTPIRDVVGEDPVEFADTFLENYAGARWINKERRRLVETIDRAAGADPDAGEAGS